MANESEGNKRISPLLEYGITKAVLHCLPNILELNKAATVCKSWNETAKIIKKNRNQIYSTSNIDSYEDYSCVQELLSCMRSQPCICLVFLTHAGLAEIPPPLPELKLDGHDGAHFGRCTEYRLLHYLRRSMPLDCAIVGGIANGVVSSTPSLLTHEVEEGDGYGLLFIPEIQNLSIRHFHLDRQKMKNVGKAITSQTEEVGRLLNIKDDDQVQCLMLLGTDAYKESKCIEALCRYFQDKRNQNIAIGGGFVEAAIHPDVVDGDREYGITGLVFCGPRVKANSVIVPPDATSDSDIERILVQLKEKHLASFSGEKMKSIGFMVACVARGTHLHGRSGVESAIFRKHFPATPLLGFFGNGEIGINCLGPASSSTTPQSFQSNLPSAPKKSRIAYLHSYATTFTLISFPVE
ncbi:hypothetical protein GHT06_019586 [Daphnia sinensis]|uniref:FIST C-domain domain-containing protein n=1 Tax=Daphnia sinensis TaxID=1820382 RepID=A0AAD5KKA5_9CRUS|nr:hypothetical protein GHT06_019586 [Daphnia sinensis]